MSRRSSRGLTLIEVVAATALLGFILVGVVLAHARHTRQLTLAREKNALVSSLDRLVASWWKDGAIHLPDVREGVLAGRDDVTWEVREVGKTEFEAGIFRVSLRKAQEEKPILAVDVVVKSE